jgi:serine protease Do
MKSRVLLLLLIAAAGGGYVGNLVSRHPANLPIVSIANAAAGDDQTRIVDAVQAALPSVVALDVTANGTRIVSRDRLGQPFGLEPGGERITPFKERASGSGFVYDTSGLILTADHVVHGAKTITAVFSNGDKARAQIYGEDPRNDVALVKVAYAKLPPPLPLADSNSVRRGEWTIAVGEPLTLQQTVTVGVASAFGRNESILGDDGVQRTFKNLLQTSAPINPGNSGGPLLNTEGQVIAINQSVAAEAQGIGFAVPASTLQTSIAFIEKHPGVDRTEAGFLGVQLVEVNDLLRTYLDYRGKGAVVADVIAGSPAARAGLRRGDVIQAIDGKTISSASEAIRQVSSAQPGTLVRLRVWVRGASRTVSVRVTQRPLS